MNVTYTDPAKLLETQVPDYLPSAHHGHRMFRRDRPAFTQFIIREMLFDPRIQFGLGIIKGPIQSKARFNVECEDEEVQKHVLSLINDFWVNGAVQALKAVEWGYSGSEVLYRQDPDTQRIVYAGLKDFDSPSVKVVTKNGQRTGILIDHFQTVKMTPGKAVYLGGPKAFHHVHWRQIHPYYGVSRLIGAYVPWNEIWSEGGFRDIRRMWFYKNCFEGGTIYHPQGVVKLPNGVIKSQQDIAQELIEKKQTGATLTLPSTTDSKNNRTWEYLQPAGNNIPAGLFEYGGSLGVEILEALGIPPEVVESSGSEGFGSSSGRAIPETVFYAMLQEIVNWLILDFIEQIARPNVQINAALGLMPWASFKVLVHPLDAEAEEMVFDDEDKDLQGQQDEQNKSLSEGEERPATDGDPITNASRKGVRDDKASKRLKVAS